MGGIGLWLNTTSTEHHTHIRTQYKIQDTHIRNNTLQTYIYAQTQTKQYAAHNLHTICTQSAHTQDTDKHIHLQRIQIHTQKQKQRYMQHIQENTETEHTIQNTQNKQRTNTPQHTCTHSYSHI